MDIGFGLNSSERPLLLIPRAVRRQHPLLRVGVVRTRSGRIGDQKALTAYVARAVGGICLRVTRRPVLVVSWSTVVPAIAARVLVDECDPDTECALGGRLDKACN